MHHHAEHSCSILMTCAFRGRHERTCRHPDLQYYEHDDSVTKQAGEFGVCFFFVIAIEAWISVLNVGACGVIPESFCTDASEKCIPGGLHLQRSFGERLSRWDAAGLAG